MATYIRLAPEVEARLDRLAAKTGRTKAFYLREMIEGGLAELEDYYLAAQTRERVRKGKGKGKERVHSAAEVKTDLGRED